MAPLVTATAPTPARQSGWKRRFEPIALVSLVAIFVVVRLWNLTTFCLDSDEIFSLLCARFNIPHLLHAVRVDVVHPPLSYLLLWGWVRIGGESLGWLRLLPFLLSLTALIPVWVVLRQFRLTGLARIIVLALLSISDYQVFHARYVRMYALFFLLSLLSLAAFNALLAGISRKRILALTAVNLLLVYTQYFGWMVIGVEGLFLLLLDRRKLKPFLLGTLVIAALFAPWAWAAALAAMDKGGLTPNLGWIRHPKIGDVWWYYAGCDGPLWPIAAASAMVFFLFGIMAAGLWRARREIKDPIQIARWRFAALLAFIPPFATYLLSNLFRNSIWGNRHLIVSMVPYLALLALGLMSVRPRWLRAAVLTLATGWGLYGAYRVTMQPEPRTNMDVLAKQLIELQERQAPGAGPVTIDFIDPYLSFPLGFYVESHGRKWNLVNVSGVDAISGDRVWVGYNHKTWRHAQSPEELLRSRGYQIGPGVWAGDHWDTFAVFLVYRPK